MRAICASRTETTFWIGCIFSIAKDHADLAKVRPVPLVIEIPPPGAGRAGRWAIWGWPICLADDERGNYRFRSGESRPRSKPQSQRFPDNSTDQDFPPE